MAWQWYVTGLAGGRWPHCQTMAGERPVQRTNSSTDFRRERGHLFVQATWHTFHAADYQGTNALLYPRFGGYALLKPAPTEKDPAAAEVVTAGVFDDFGQVKK